MNFMEEFSTVFVAHFARRSFVQCKHPKSIVQDQTLQNGKH